MTAKQNNPFDMSNMGGLGLNQDNPLFTSMNMMRQVWENMASNPMGLSAETAIPSAEELDKRIKELRAVENWLRLNLSMLTSTIQGLEIQRSTLSTLQSFAESGMAAMPTSTPSTDPEAGTETEENNELSESLMQAGQNWWNMMQQQFDTLTQATAQTMQQAQSTSATVAPDIPTASADTTFGKSSEPTKASAKKASAKKTATKKAAKKSTQSTKPTSSEK